MEIREMKDLGTFCKRCTGNIEQASKIIEDARTEIDIMKKKKKLAVFEASRLLTECNRCYVKREYNL